jgi:hypothetical protein
MNIKYSHKTALFKCRYSVFEIPMNCTLVYTKVKKSLFEFEVYICSLIQR